MAIILRYGRKIWQGRTDRQNTGRGFHSCQMWADTMVLHLMVSGCCQV